MSVDLPDLRGALSNPSLVARPHTLRFTTPLHLSSGRTLDDYQLSFETYGTLGPAADNAVLVCHSLTKTAHAAGRHTPGETPSGWWHAAIGPGRMLDTDRYFVICSDTLGAGASSGPATHPDFPVVTVRDIVAAQHRLTQALGISRLHAVIGGCFGGQQALQWAISHPEAVGSAVVIATTPDTSPHTVAIFSVMRHLIPYGVNSAVMAAVPLWMSSAALREKFGRRTAHGGDYRYTLDPEFAVEAFLARIAERPEPAIDPDSLLHLMRAEEYFDLAHDHGSLEAALAPVTARTLFVSYRTDWRYPPEEADVLHRTLLRQGTPSRHAVLDSPLGHGAFLYDVPPLARQVAPFLAAAERSHA